jgi:hypothetical protein
MSFSFPQNSQFISIEIQPNVISPLMLSLLEDSPLDLCIEILSVLHTNNGRSLDLIRSYVFG